MEVGGGGGGGEVELDVEGGLEREVVMAEGSNWPSSSWHKVLHLSSFCTVCHSFAPIPLPKSLRAQSLWRLHEHPCVPFGFGSKG